jgi:hypothetical protein
MTKIPFHAPDRLWRKGFAPMTSRSGARLVGFPTMPLLSSSSTTASMPRLRPIRLGGCLSGVMACLAGERPVGLCCSLKSADDLPRPPPAMPAGSAAPLRGQTTSLLLKRRVPCPPGCRKGSHLGDGGEPHPQRPAAAPWQGRPAGAHGLILDAARGLAEGFRWLFDGLVASQSPLMLRGKPTLSRHPSATAGQSRACEPTRPGTCAARRSAR